MNPLFSWFYGTGRSLGLRRVRRIAGAIMLTFGCLDLAAQTLSNPNASSNTRAVYEYLKTVGRAGATNSLILGQHAGHGSTITRA